MTPSVSKRAGLSLLGLLVMLAVVGWGATVTDPETHPLSEAGKDAAKVITLTVPAALLFAKLMARYAARFEKKYDADQARNETQFRRLEHAVGTIHIELGKIVQRQRAQDERAADHDQMDRDNYAQMQRDVKEVREQFASGSLVNSLQMRVSTLETRLMR